MCDISTKLYLTKFGVLHENKYLGLVYLVFAVGLRLKFLVLVLTFVILLAIMSQGRAVDSTAQYRPTDLCFATRSLNYFLITSGRTSAVQVSCCQTLEIIHGPETVSQLKKTPSGYEIEGGALILQIQETSMVINRSFGTGNLMLIICKVDAHFNSLCTQQTNGKWTSAETRITFYGTCICPMHVVSNPTIQTSTVHGHPGSKFIVPIENSLIKSFLSVTIFEIFAAKIPDLDLRRFKVI